MGLGLRVPWKDVDQARLLLRPTDESILDDTRALKDKYTYTMDGIPGTASGPEVSKFCHDIGWKALPQSKMMARSTATWVVTAEEDPKSWCYKWADGLVIVTKADPDELRQKRNLNFKKRAQASAASTKEVPMAPVMRAPSQRISRLEPRPHRHHLPTQSSMCCVHMMKE